MTNTTIHVAAENKNYRESLKATFIKYNIGDVVVSSTEGEAGVVAVRTTRPNILVVSSGIDEDTVEHLGWYRKAAPQAYIVGFAFNENEAERLRDAGVNKVVMSNIGRSAMVDVMMEADQRAPA